MTGYRDENLEAACAGLLSLLPESCCRAEALAAACAHYGVSAAGVRRAAELPEHYELQYRGVGLLLGEYLLRRCAPSARPTAAGYARSACPPRPSSCWSSSPPPGAPERLQTGALAQQVRCAGCS
ncbi:MAG: hypothetical protein ACLUEK_01240 [Oscillospiraceae bacterium]